MFDDNFADDYDENYDDVKLMTYEFVFKLVKKLPQLNVFTTNWEIEFDEEYEEPEIREFLERENRTMVINVPNCKYPNI